jgi:hypothetical protein
MRAVFSSTDVTEVSYFKSILDEYKIPCFIQNENTANPGIAGATFLAALCVLNDCDCDKAIGILKARQIKPIEGESDWTCRACGEVNPGNFDSCWKCDALRPNVRH